METLYIYKPVHIINQDLYYIRLLRWHVYGTLGNSKKNHELIYVYKLVPCIIIKACFDEYENQYLSANVFVVCVYI